MVRGQIILTSGQVSHIVEKNDRDARCEVCGEYLPEVYLTCETCGARVCDETCLGEHLEECMAEAQGRRMV